MKTTFLRAVGLLTLLTLIGCGKDTESYPTTAVTGKVTYKGKALPGGRIMFTSSSDIKKTGLGQIKADGTYEVPAAPQGECQVTIENSHLQGSTAIPGGAAMPGAPDTTGQKYVPLNPNYVRSDLTPLKTNVTGTTHTYDIELK